jgi:hypothetical protein
MTFRATKEPPRSKVAPLRSNPSRTRPASQPKRLSGVKPKAKTRNKARIQPGPTPFSPRKGTKMAKVLALLKRPQGAGLKELLRATGWQPHSVRGFLSGIVVRKMGLKVSSIKAGSGERRYAVEA